MVNRRTSEREVNVPCFGLRYRKGAPFFPLTMLLALTPSPLENLFSRTNLPEVGIGGGIWGALKKLYLTHKTNFSEVQKKCNPVSKPSLVCKRKMIVRIAKPSENGILSEWFGAKQPRHSGIIFAKTRHAFLTGLPYTPRWKVQRFFFVVFFSPWFPSFLA